MTEEDTIEYYFIAAKRSEIINKFIVEKIIWKTFSGYTHFSNSMDLNEQKKNPTTFSSIEKTFPYSE